MAAQLPDATALDAELVVWDAAGHLAFEQLQNRLQRRGAGVVRAAGEWPAHFVAFDLRRLSGTCTTSWPYRRRRTALESVFAAQRLSTPWVLCPSTTDPDTVRAWLTWASVGMEGVLTLGCCRGRKYAVGGDGTEEDAHQPQRDALDPTLVTFEHDVIDGTSAASSSRTAAPGRRIGVRAAVPDLAVRVIREPAPPRYRTPRR